MPARKFPRAVDCLIDLASVALKEPVISDGENSETPGTEALAPGERIRLGRGGKNLPLWGGTEKIRSSGAFALV